MRTVVLAVALAVACAPGAVAAPKPKPVCNLLLDPRGDALAGTPAGLDLLGGDVATNAAYLTVALRLAGPATGSDPAAPFGRGYLVELSGEKPVNRIWLRYVETPVRTDTTYGYYRAATRAYVPIGRASLRVSDSVLFLTLPLLAVEAHGRFTPGSRLTGLRAEAARVVGATVTEQVWLSDLLETDTTGKGATYRAGTPSCVRVGP